MEWQVGDYVQITSFPDFPTGVNYYKSHLHEIFKITFAGETIVHSAKHGIMSKQFLTNVTKQELIKRFNQFVIL
jgi:antirestriction protein ArdC